MTISNTNELQHWGIKGMKWGVRRYQNEDGTLTEAGKKRYSENYSSQQRIRDKKIYGEGAVNRINKRMLKGESIQSARHNEVVRKDRVTKAKKLGKTAAKSALVVGGAAAVATILKKKGFGDQTTQDILTEEVINVGRQVINNLFR